jgi:hypothetical protein
MLIFDWQCLQFSLISTIIGKTGLLKFGDTASFVVYSGLIGSYAEDITRIFNIIIVIGIARGLDRI